MNVYHNLIFIFVISLFITLFSFLNCDRIKSKIYLPIESEHFCFRRLNATHQIGCNSKEGGNVGVVYITKNETDIDYVVKSGPHYPYIPVIRPKDFNLDNMKLFKSASDRISGLIVLDEESSTSRPNLYSPDSSCPNEEFDLYANDVNYGHCAKQKWNDKNNTNDLMFYDWPFPIYFIRDNTSINEIQDCFDKFGGPDWPLCAIELVSPMNAAKDAITCMRRSIMQKNSYFALSPSLFCDPLGGTNIFNTLLETSNNVPISNKSVVVLASRLDSFSMFDNISPGADSAISSLVTLLAVANTLNTPDIKNKIKLNSDDRNVLYALFDGEAFDYIGSSRAVYDITNGKFPVDPEGDVNRSQIRTEHFSHFIELNQLGFHGNEEKQTLWIHKDVHSNQDLINLENIIISNVKETDELEIRSKPDGSPLPPSSLQSFLKHDKEIVGVVIANHEREYTNQFYNSLFDDFSNLNRTDTKVSVSKRLSNVATVISRSIYSILTKEQDVDLITVNETLIDDLLECYLINSACRLFKYVDPSQTPSTDKSDPYPTYVGVYNPGAATTSTLSRYFTHLLLSYFTGDKVEVETKKQCSDLNKSDKSFYYYWMANKGSNGNCIKSQALRTLALSPAFISGQIKTSDTYSTWTESQWRNSSVRLFIMPSALQQWITLITGLIILCVSFFIVYFIDKKSSMLFDSCDVIIPEQTLTVGC